MDGLTYADLVTGTHILMAIIGIETGILIGLVQRAGSFRNLFRLTSKTLYNNDDQTTKHEGEASKNPKVEKNSIEGDHS
jgi:hypothetical protein